ncbi:MAG: hypothetical protein K8S99_10735 [Planctomycetes bacterium]|nr:hypothetical protein [Planctomycetota bacterium]
MAIAHRGIILSPTDLSWPGWPDLMERVGLNVLGLHSDFRSLVAFMESPSGDRLRKELDRRSIDLEFELHFVGSFMTKELFGQHPEYFAMDILGQRDEGGNPSVCEQGVLDLARAAAAEVARRLPPTTHRHHLYAHDGAQEWCNAPGCVAWSPSDQDLILINAFLDGLCSVDAMATTAYAAYMTTLPAPDPHRVKPAEGVFLEFAPYRRNFTRPLDDAKCDRNRRQVAALDELLRVFPANTAKVLEYWIDVSYWSNYRKPAKSVVPDADLLRRDIAVYASRGMQWVTSFACWMGEDYMSANGPMGVERYAAALR